MILVSPLFSIAAEGGKGKEIKVVVLPWEVRAVDEFKYIEDALFDMVSSRISVERHLRVVAKSSTEEVFFRYKGRSLTDDLIRKIGRELMADYVLIGSLTFIGENLSIDTRVLEVEGEEAPIHSVSQGRGIDSLIPLLGRSILKLNKGMLGKKGLPVTVTSFGSNDTDSFGPPSQPLVEEGNKKEDFIIDARKEKTRKAFWKSTSFITELKGIDVGDTDGDGKNEIVVIDRHSLWIYRKAGDRLELVKEFKGKISEENLHVDVADLNGNGNAEIYVTRLSNDRLDSYVLEYTNGEYTKVSSGLKWFLMVSSFTEGEMLLGQRKGMAQVFFGKVKKLYWKDNNLSEGEDIDLPSGFPIYGFSSFDLDDKEEKGIVGFDSDDYLRLYLRAEGGSWEEVWKSMDPFGGTLNAIISKGHEMTASKREIYIKGRIIQRDLDGDGRKEIVVNRNIASGLGKYIKGRRSYKKSEILNMLWNGEELEENWKTRMIKGYIADFQIEDIDNDGIKELIIAVVSNFKGVIKKPQSRIISYRLSVR
ncbi:MAG: FG-GAP-like repeat-containing protein [Thermodesulfobacteriota bacterium]